jgi:hypothetical protein
MENTTTRIADLPENITMQPGGGAPGDMGSTQYTPINVHPNPYGHSQQKPPFMPNPQQTSAPRNIPPMYSSGGEAASGPPHIMPQIPGPQSQFMSEEQQMYIKQMQNQRLPSRDIPRDTTGYTHDEEIQQNYIPKPTSSAAVLDYVREQEKTTEKNMREYEDKKKRESKLDAIISEFQTPIFITLLFFIFQMPIMNTMLFKRFPLFALYNDDGNFNFVGLLFKSILFGFAFYSVMKGAVFVSEW